MPLSELTIRHARITCKNYTVGDFDGLSLGAYPEVSFADGATAGTAVENSQLRWPPTDKIGVRLLLLTGVRTGELRYATPDQFDLEKQLWVIPPEVVKQLQVKMRSPGRASGEILPYIVPLSVQALEIVRYMLDQILPALRFLFSHRSNLQLRISENTLNNAQH